MNQRILFLSLSQVSVVLIISASQFTLPSHLSNGTLREKVWEEHFNLCHVRWINVVCLSLFNIAVFSFVRSCPFSSLNCFCRFTSTFMRNRMIMFHVSFIAYSSGVMRANSFSPQSWKIKGSSKLFSWQRWIQTIIAALFWFWCFLDRVESDERSSFGYPFHLIAYVLNKSFLVLWRIHGLLRCRLSQLNWECQDKIMLAFFYAHADTSGW